MAGHGRATSGAKPFRVGVVRNSSFVTVARPAPDGPCAPVVQWYIRTMVTKPLLEVERVQTGVRLEKRLLKVLKALAELKDLSLGDLLEGIVLHAFEGKAPFSKETLKQIADLKAVYGLHLRATDSHRLKEKP